MVLWTFQVMLWLRWLIFSSIFVKKTFMSQLYLYSMVCVKNEWNVLKCGGGCGNHLRNAWIYLKSNICGETWTCLSTNSLHPTWSLGWSAEKSVFVLHDVQIKLRAFNHLFSVFFFIHFLLILRIFANVWITVLFMTFTTIPDNLEAWERLVTAVPC